jgi:hypothetical protein
MLLPQISAFRRVSKSYSDLCESRGADHSKGAEAEVPEAIELEPKAFSSQELKALNLLIEKDEDVQLVETASAT